jgi:hypothetical protein
MQLRILHIRIFIDGLYRQPGHVVIWSYKLQSPSEQRLIIYCASYKRYVQVSQSDVPTLLYSGEDARRLQENSCVISDGPAVV